MISDDVKYLDSFEKKIKPTIYSKYLFYQDKGYIHYDLIYDRVEIIYFYVKEEYRGKKIGYQLLEKLVNIYNNISLEVKCTNEKAIRLYEHFGFKRIKVIKNYYKNIDGYLMVRGNS